MTEWSIRNRRWSSICIHVHEASGDGNNSIVIIVNDSSDMRNRIHGRGFWKLNLLERGKWEETKVDDSNFVSISSVKSIVVSGVECCEMIARSVLMAHFEE